MTKPWRLAHLSRLNRYITLENARSILIAVGMMIIVMGTVGDATDFLRSSIKSFSGWVAISLIVIGAVAWVRLFRKDLQIAPISGLPHPETGFHPDPSRASIVVTTLADQPHNGIQQIIRIARREFGVDAMPARTIRRLHGDLPTDVFIAWQSGVAVGYMATFVPNEPTWKLMHERASLDPTALRASMFEQDTPRWSFGRVYLESVVCRGDGFRRSIVWSHLCAVALDELLSRSKVGGYTLNEVRICGFGASLEGRLWLGGEQQLGLSEHHSERDTTWAPFYSGTVPIGRIEILQREAEAIVHRLRRHQGGI